MFADRHHGNAMSSRRMRELRELLRELAQDDSVRAVVLRAQEGKSFAVGGDFREMIGLTAGEETDAWTDATADLCVACLEMPKPTVAALDGHVIGIGLLIALACDYRLGSESCSLRMPHFALGLACTFGGYLLERSVGRHVMQDMLMSGEPWSPESSLADGLLHEIVPDRDLARTALKRALRFAAYDLPAFAATKHTLSLPHTQQLRAMQHSTRLRNRADFATGLPRQRMRRILGRE
ncbi:enoyl-CoA hydratase/isomerase family protein [Streptomyces sp. NPDC005727]|uniref:enoyl-CoA hydratase/isomerase family protein n=1 Tax=unclassified Streptomyces TaxID=2593676 RepID=UPI0033DB4E2E